MVSNDYLEKNQTRIYYWTLNSIMIKNIRINSDIMKRKLLLFICSIIFIQSSFAQQYDTLKIAAPPGGGMYLGQYEWMIGQVDTFEMAIKRPTAWFGDRGGMDLNNSAGFPVFDYLDAEMAWEDGTVIIAHAIETYPNPDDNAVAGFTVDKMLNGDYDTALVRLADEFAQFGKPMFFNTAREMLGYGADYMCGFGSDGDKSFEWALLNAQGLDKFDPSIFPNASLYSDLGDPEISDGVERWVASQRYYYNFFVLERGLKFLTFETGGYPVIDSLYVQRGVQEALEEYPGIDPEHTQKLYESSFNFANYYPGDDYTDWISINFYTIDYYADGWSNLNFDYLIPTKKYLDDLDYTLNQIAQVAPDKPVMFLELGFPDGMEVNSAYAASKIDSSLNHFINHCPEINGLSFWSWHPLWMIPDFWPFDCLIRPGTIQADTLSAIIDRNPEKFHSCVYFSDGSLHPFCQTVGVGKLEREPGFKVFPNPARNNLFISEAEPGCNIEIISVDGKLVYQTVDYNGSLDISFLPAGIYFLKVENVGEPAEIKKFIKQ